MGDTEHDMYQKMEEEAKKIAEDEKKNKQEREKKREARKQRIANGESMKPPKKTEEELAQIKKKLETKRTKFKATRTSMLKNLSSGNVPSQEAIIKCLKPGVKARIVKKFTTDKLVNNILLRRMVRWELLPQEKRAQRFNKFHKRYNKAVMSNKPFRVPATTPEANNLILTASVDKLVDAMEAHLKDRYDDIPLSVKTKLLANTRRTLTIK